MFTKFKHLFVSFTLLIMLNGLPFTLIKHPYQTGARCLDGSPSAIYVYEGPQKDKFLLYFEGGGVCSGYSLTQTLADCLARSQTHLGSSSKYPEVRDFSRFTLLSNNQEQNPLYANWTKAFIPYCDGSMHQGSRSEPVKFKNSELYFRGLNNTLAHFAFLDDIYGLFGGEQIVVTGTSAGAEATMIWGNTVYKRARNPAGVLLIADSGVFVSDPYLAPRIEQYIFIGILANEETPVPIQECQKLSHQCTTAEVLSDYILPPIILLQSLYDVYSIRHLLGIECALNSFPATLQDCSDQEMKKIEKHRIQTLRILQKFAKHPRNSVWAISCAQHGFLYDFSYYDSPKYLVPQIFGQSVFDIIRNSPERSGQVVIDSLKWPNNEACNGIVYLQVS